MAKTERKCKNKLKRGLERLQQFKEKFTIKASKCSNLGFENICYCNPAVMSPIGKVGKGFLENVIAQRNQL